MDKLAKKVNKQGLPVMFKPIMWSYNFDELDPKKHGDELVVNTINYGNIAHWRWLNENLGKANIKRIILSHPETEFLPESKNLARLAFNIDAFRHAL